jgi:DNA invertase Pin-like site-specific DNA recombinase
MQNYVIYKRLSRDSKTKENLGLDAQQSAISNFLKSKHDYTIVETFTEVESGTRKGNNRPELKKALAACANTKSTLIISTLSRLSRNVHFISGLIEANVDFIAIDMPVWNKTMLFVAAAFAEQEADFISQRTKAGLAEAKKRGKILGNPQNLKEVHRLKGNMIANANKTTKAQNFAYMTAPRLQLLRKQGQTLTQIAEQMNALNTQMPSGKQGKWNATTVRNCLKTAHYL